MYVIFVILLLILVIAYSQGCKENYYIEPNMIRGGAMPDSGMTDVHGHYVAYNHTLELEGPGDAAWSGY